jgi:acetyl esterase/lipase
MTLDRRMLLGGGLAVGAAVSLAANARAAGESSEIVELWPAGPPGGGASNKPESIGREGAGKGALSGVGTARMRVYRPARPNGTAVLVLGGGGYFRIQLANESLPASRWLAGLGITAFELIYRMPGDGWSREAPFADAQRAMRLIRARAATYGVRADKVGVLGFSAGGHLAGMTAANGAARYAPADAADGQSARPDFAGLLYPVATLRPPFDTTRTKFWLVGEHPTPEETRAWSVETYVDNRTPPTFLAQNADDPIAAIDNSLIMFDALRRAKVPSEMHVFEKGGHGFGMGELPSTDRSWPMLFERWLAGRGMI